MRRAKPRRTWLGRAHGPSAARPGDTFRVGSPNPPRPGAGPREPSAAARAAWFDFNPYGTCGACGKQRVRLHAHHVVLAQMIRVIAPEREFDLVNRWLIGWTCCHAGHHEPGVNDTRLDYASVPAPAIAFGYEILGPGPAARFFWRRYKNAPDQPQRGSV